MSLNENSAPTRPRPQKSLANRFFRGLGEIALILVIALVLSFIIKTFFFRAFVIPSGSMENTLQVGDRIFVNLMVKDEEKLKHGDVVVFEDRYGWLPSQNNETSAFSDIMQTIGVFPDASEQHLVKRIIGMPGDEVTIDPQTGQIKVNGETIDEPYLYPGVAGSDVEFDVTVPEGKLWVMGDHRNASADSRSHINGPNEGFVDIDAVTGRAEIIIWPFDHFGSAGSDDQPFEKVEPRDN